jgi:hypothetical protein
MILTFFEPSNRFASYDDYDNNTLRFTLEGVFLCFLVSDMILELIYKGKGGLRELSNFMLLSKLISFPVLFIDYVIAISLYPYMTIRFARVFRACINNNIYYN